MPGKGNLQLTGKLGEVIRESAQIAMSWVKANAYLLGITKSEAESTLNDRDVHLHMPEGGIGKEGPSAGTAILTAFVSLFTKTRVDPDTAMTGEISLLGQVLPVGGLKEKILAAHRAGIKSELFHRLNSYMADQAQFQQSSLFLRDVSQILMRTSQSPSRAELNLCSLKMCDKFCMKHSEERKWRRGGKRRFQWMKSRKEKGISRIQEGHRHLEIGIFMYMRAECWL